MARYSVFLFIAGLAAGCGQVDPGAVVLGLALLALLGLWLDLLLGLWLDRGWSYLGGAAVARAIWKRLRGA